MMTPTRLTSSYGWIKHGLAGLRPGFVLEDNAVGVMAGVAALVSTLITANHVLLAILAIAMMTVDLLAGMGAAATRGDFDEGVLYRGLASKCVRAMLVPCGLSVDLVTLTIGNRIAAVAPRVDFAAELGAAGLFTTGALSWLVIAEVKSVVTKVESTAGGEGAVWPGIKAGLRLLRAALLQAAPTDPVSTSSDAKENKN